MVSCGWSLTQIGHLVPESAQGSVCFLSAEKWGQGQGGQEIVGRICEAQGERRVDPPSCPRVVREGQPLVPKGKEQVWKPDQLGSNLSSAISYLYFKISGILISRGYFVVHF